ncbi:hypothetical protein [Streptomyces sp. AN091965]|uniref:hypothetical protein n=1 Tax=Streptomyces sp. AN091965 TaxID=2927803 RepID=UPI001F60DBAA|nr:hypothetical protein [Streptomyces sp. AN091965]MCI3928919.1 hypothetical protein [Streptomyces sp. AN091965]
MRRFSALPPGQIPPHRTARDRPDLGHRGGDLVRTRAFRPNGTLSDRELAAEHLAGFRWWRQGEIEDQRGPDPFGPSDTAALLSALLAGGVPDEPLLIGP